jgi:hypothetical protein
MASLASACILSTALGGCAIFADPNAWPQKFAYGDSVNLASGANVRYSNDRLREMPGGPPLPTMCTEPAPDVAVAFGTSLQAAANINNQGSGGLGAGTSEAALALAGRSASVLALRDGLYATCQAYANGALGQSAYALGLSQYGNLLVALTAHDAGAVGGTNVNATGPNIQLNIPQPAPAKTSGGNDNPGTQTVAARFADASIDDQLPLRLVQAPPPAAASPAASPPAAKAPAGQQVVSQQSGVTANGNAPNPALFTPYDSEKTALMVACISEYDPTRIGAVNPNTGQPVHSGVLSESFCHDYVSTTGHNLVQAARAKQLKTQPAK